MMSPHLYVGWHTSVFTNADSRGVQFCGGNWIKLFNVHSNVIEGAFSSEWRPEICEFQHVVSIARCSALQGQLTVYISDITHSLVECFHVDILHLILIFQTSQSVQLIK